MKTGRTRLQRTNKKQMDDVTKIPSHMDGTDEIIKQMDDNNKIPKPINLIAKIPKEKIKLKDAVSFIAIVIAMIILFKVGNNYLDKLEELVLRELHEQRPQELKEAIDLLGIERNTFLSSLIFFDNSSNKPMHLLKPERGWIEHLVIVRKMLKGPNHDMPLVGYLTKQYNILDELNDDVLLYLCKKPLQWSCYTTLLLNIQMVLYIEYQKIPIRILMKTNDCEYNKGTLIDLFKGQHNNHQKFDCQKCRLQCSNTTVI